MYKVLTGRLLGLFFREQADGEGRIIKCIRDGPDYKVKGGCLVSVIIPAYNEENYLEDALVSVMNQTYDNIEIIVVDDCSTDKTVELAEQYGVHVIEKEYREANNSKTRNLGALQSIGDVLCFMDADTALEETIIESCVESIQDGYKLVTTNHCSLDSVIASFIFATKGFLLPTLRSVNGQFIAVDREAFDYIGGYDENIAYQVEPGEDKEMPKRLAMLYSDNKICNLKTKFTATSARRYKQGGFVLSLQSSDVKTEVFR